MSRNNNLLAPLIEEGCNSPSPYSSPTQVSPGALLTASASGGNRIFIARDHNSYIVSIMIGPQQRDIELYWQGKGIIPHHIQVIDPDDIQAPLGILEILKTEKVK